MELVLSTVAQGLLWAVLAIGLFITFRILDIADLSIEGTYPLGGAIAVMTITGGGSPLLAVIFAFLADALPALSLVFCTQSSRSLRFSPGSSR